MKKMAYMAMKLQTKLDTLDCDIGIEITFKYSPNGLMGVIPVYNTMENLRKDFPDAPVAEIMVGD
jgi:hypothetical protein